jgi:hypothetical protein
MCLEFIFIPEKCIVEPYTSGINKHLFNKVVGFQIIGEFNSLKPIGWKKIFAFKIVKIQISKIPFRLPLKEGAEMEIKKLNKNYI